MIPESKEQLLLTISFIFYENGGSVSDLRLSFIGIKILKIEETPCYKHNLN